MYSPRHSPLPHDHGGTSTGAAAERDGSSSRSSSASGSAASGTRSPSRSSSAARLRSSRPDVSTTSLPMETIQSLNAAYNAGPIYMGDGVGSPVQGRSSPVSSGASGKSNSLSPRNSPTPSHDSRSSSLGSSQGLHGSPLTGSDGAEPHPHPPDQLSLNNSNSGPQPHSHTHPHPHHPEDMRPPQEAVLLDVHAQLREYQLENASLRQELEAKEAKLASSMNSIKTFWSPELKKERALRKEEAARMQALREQCRTAMEENQNYCQDLKQMQDELQHQREFNAQMQASLSSHAASAGAHLAPRHEAEALRAERERLAKEVFLLRKTLEEMEIRSETQKQTLAARDESIKKLLEMLQSKGLPAKHLAEAEREEADRLRSKVVEAESRILQLETMLDQRDRERSRLADELRQSAAQAGWFEQQLVDTVLQSDESRQINLVKSLCKTAKTKEEKIATLESRVREYEHELRRVRSLGSLSPEEREDRQREIDDYKSHSKLLKNQVDQLKLELNKKSSEVQALQTKIETLTHQHQDYQAHVSLLKESLAAKEQHSSILQADVEALRARLDEKEMTLVRKEQLLSTLSTDKTKRFSEVNELKEMLDIKERKIGVLQRKIDNLQEQLREKEEQCDQMRAKLSAAQAEQTSSDSAVSSLEDALMEKGRALERAREEKERSTREHEEAMQGQQRQIKEVKARLESLLKELSEKEASLMDLKEHASTLASSSLKKDSKITTLELAVAQKTEETARLESDLRKLREDKEEEEKRAAKALEEATARHKDETAKTQSEVDRLLEIMKEMEGEKNDKDKRVTELESIIRKHCPGQLKDATKRLTGVKRDQQLQKRKNAQLLEEARRREGELSTDTQQLQTFVRQRDERIEELEEALKESVSITADREMVLAQQTQTISNLQRQIDNLKRELEQVKKQLSTASNKLSTTTTVLREKEAKLSALQTERRKTLEEAMEMKQEAITAAIGEKDAHIALLELNRKNPKACEELKGLKKEKDALVQLLKDETQRRIKFIHSDIEKPAALEQSPVTPDQVYQSRFTGAYKSVTL
ncbi:ELKS/Rab6-interacting/CAST family member 1-like isoform X3 [Acanthaster planci]|uniref:ELKS/Rab6-interacting/CAST family member 1-like isoform X3 n=1 Tax=Acanthaster planci TaxID=133434 RepID=A0A8B7XN14_ACAPL|nr:ELKS/Rab6-interacting/CAST family member 1-like isoform X3 [Acanthaster planci]